MLFKNILISSIVLNVNIKGTPCNPLLTTLVLVLFQIMLDVLFRIMLDEFGPYLQSTIKERNKFSLELEDPSF